MSSVKSGLMMIDQHRAHTRILYEDYLRQLAQRKPSAQRLLFPEMVQFAQPHSNACPPSYQNWRRWALSCPTWATAATR